MPIIRATEQSDMSAALTFSSFADGSATDADSLASVQWLHRSMPAGAENLCDVELVVTLVKTHLPLCLPLLDFVGATRLLTNLVRVANLSAPMSAPDRAFFAQHAYAILNSPLVDTKLRSLACDTLMVRTHISASNDSIASQAASFFSGNNSDFNST